VDRNQRCSFDLVRSQPCRDSCEVWHKLGKAQMGIVLWTVAFWVALNAVVVAVRMYVTRDARERSSAPHRPSMVWSHFGSD
jgi:hypothetical protein